MNLLPLNSVCVYCGSSVLAARAHIDLAAEMGRAIAASKIRLVYGGGGLGLMGAVALAAHDAGGEVLGVMPRFLEAIEPPPSHIPIVRVDNMHERKKIMLDESDAFIVLPGGIGTLEEAVETLSWRRLNLHHKPMAFVGRAYWQPFFDMIEHTIDQNFTPPGFREFSSLVDTPQEALENLRMGLIQPAM